MDYNCPEAGERRSARSAARWSLFTIYGALLAGIFIYSGGATGAANLIAGAALAALLPYLSLPSW